MTNIIANRVAIIGLGLIGGSLAAALKKADAVGEIRALNRNPATVQYALQRGIIDKACTSIEDLIADLGDGDIIVLGVPVLAVGPILEMIRPALAAGVTLTDVGSTKSWLVAEAERVYGQLPTGLVPAHPIAGSERNGVEAADAALFNKHRVILTPTGFESDDHLQRVRQMWLCTGALIDEMSAQYHDTVLGATSHLPHVLAYVMVDLLCSMEQRGEVLRYAAGGFRDFTRIAGSDPVMWRDILIANREAISGRIDEFEAHLDRLKEALESETAEKIHEIFERAQSTRNAFVSQAEKSS